MTAPETPYEPLESFGLKTPAKLDLTNLSNDQLLAMRHEIDTILDVKLDSIDMKEELAIQLMQAKALYESAKLEKAPANQMSQVLNTISSVMAAISKTSAEVYSVERLKKIEAAVLSAVKTLNTEEKERFFDLYKEYLDS